MLICGKQSIRFRKAPYIISAASVVGSKEFAGPLGKRFDFHAEDDLGWERDEGTNPCDSLPASQICAKLVSFV